MRNSPLILLGLIWLVVSILLLYVSIVIEGVRVKHLLLLINALSSGAFMIWLYNDRMTTKNKRGG